MAIRKADAEWSGGLDERQRDDEAGQRGLMRPVFVQVAHGRRHWDQPGRADRRSPRRLLLDAVLGDAGARRLPAGRVHTAAKVHFGPEDGGFSISKIELTTEGMVPGIDDAKFQEFAAGAKANCPVSKALAGTEITLNAKLV